MASYVTNTVKLFFALCVGMFSSSLLAHSDTTGQMECPMEQGMPGMGGMMGMPQGMMGMSQGGMMGMGQGMGGMMGGLGMGAINALNLTPQQRTQVNSIQDKLRKDLWQIQGKMLDAQAGLRDAWAAERPEPKKVRQSFNGIADLHGQMIEAEVMAFNQTQDVLTEEQRKKLRNLRGTGMMGGGGAGMMGR